MLLPKGTRTNIRDNGAGDASGKTDYRSFAIQLVQNNITDASNDPLSFGRGIDAEDVRRDVGETHRRTLVHFLQKCVGSSECRDNQGRE
jgi:hypothetical protein